MTFPVPLCTLHWTFVGKSTQQSFHDIFKPYYLVASSQDLGKGWQTVLEFNKHKDRYTGLRAFE